MAFCSSNTGRKGGILLTNFVINPETPTVTPTEATPAAY